MYGDNNAVKKFSGQFTVPIRKRIMIKVKLYDFLWQIVV